MTSKKRKTLLDADDDNDNFDEDDSGSDFDDDEDPDQIEVPGGGRDLNTAVTYAQNIRSGVGVATKGGTPIPISGAKIVVGNNKIKPISLLRINNNNNNIVTSVNNRNNNNISTNGSSNNNNNNISQIIKTTTAATTKTPTTVGATPTVGGVALGGKLTVIPIAGRNVALDNNLSNMPKKLNNAVTVSYGGGASQIRTLKVAGNIGGVGNNQKLPIATAPGSGGPAAGTSGSGAKGNTSMMEAVQKLIAMNPEYLTSGIPNTVFQMFMQSMQRPQTTPAPNQPMNPGAMVTTAAAATAHASAVAYVQQEEDEVDYEEIGVAETYADYWPAKLKLGKETSGMPLWETASLSSVEPCDVYYKLSLPLETIHSGHLERPATGVHYVRPPRRTIICFPGRAVGLDSLSETALVWARVAQSPA
ncbi:GM11504 [Drosophila sechellia]|uniref:GM11504 n=1 Tax=Drosophila sechellia TaxID=7238 RepID=B4IGP3_DROSE|nr:GM11504 [Drosophila sechellia]